MKFWVFGGSGTLGHHVVAVALGRGHDVSFPSHENCPIGDRIRVALLQPKAELPDVIINCAGALPGADVEEMILTNGLGPHNLVRFKVPMIHMSTDCVFSGESVRNDTFETPLRSGDAMADPMDLYGRSKFLGEPMQENVMVVRGSFIDPSSGFLHWLLNARGRVDAWMRACWNGTSALRMAGHLVDLAEGGGDGRGGVYHIASPTDVTKGWMVRKFVEELNLPLDLKMVNEPVIWRVLEPDIETIPVEKMCDELIAEIREVRKNDN